MIGLEGEQQNSPHYFLGKQSKWYVFFNSSVYVKVRNTPHSNHASIPTNMKVFYSTKVFYSLTSAKQSQARQTKVNARAGTLLLQQLSNTRVKQEQLELRVCKAPLGTLDQMEKMVTLAPVVMQAPRVNKGTQLEEIQDQVAQKVSNHI